MRDNAYMYTNNPFLPKVRRLAVNDVIYRHLSYSEVARKYGTGKSTICKWMKKADPDHRVFIETIPSRPHHHPQEIKPEVIARVIELRQEFNRCAPVLHEYLKREDIKISLASVGRILKRNKLIRKPKPPIYGDKNPHRPPSSFPGELVEIDTMHVIKYDYSRFYIYAMIDTFSRFAYAEYRPKIGQDNSLIVVKHAQNYCQFPFKMVQADNGPEFRSNFEFKLRNKNIAVRHSRVRRPNDNAHVERFIRTIQEECFKFKEPKEKTANQIIQSYLKYYNFERLHLGLKLQTPAQIVSKVMS
jgi:transposase InsO family protein